MTSETEFVEFAEATSPRLRRAAFLLCGDWHTAEDLVQTTLAKVFVSWHKIRRQDAAHAYAERTLVNTYLTHNRLKRSGEVPTGNLPECPVESPAPETRIVVLDALATLPPRGRAVVVLRYWADLSVEQVAAVLGCSPGNVKSQSARAQGRGCSRRDRDYAGREDRLRRQHRLGHGDADHDRDQHAREADQGRWPALLRDRDHAGREDRLRRQHGHEYGDADLDGDQHAGQADQGRCQPEGDPPGGGTHSLKVRSHGRSRSRRTGRPPTSLVSHRAR